MNDQPSAIQTALEGYETVPFPRAAGVVYFIGIETSGEFLPVYVGESRRNIGRVGDYVSGQFTAATDFKVGIAVSHLKRGHNVVVKYRALDGGAVARRTEEARLIKAFEVQGLLLLNRLRGYDYRRATETTERAKIKEFTEKIVAHGLARRA